MPQTDFIKNGRQTTVSEADRLPVDIGSGGTVNLNGDVIAEFNDVEQSLGLRDDPAADTDTADVGLIGLFKRLLGKLPALSSGRVPVDGSGVTQPVSGTVTANAGTNLNTSALALESGNLASIAGFQIPPYDNLEVTYRTTGNGTGEIDTVVFKVGATAVATLTLVYDGSDRLSTVTKS